MNHPTTRLSRLVGLNVVGAVGLGATLVGLGATLYWCLSFKLSRDPRVFSQQLDKRITMGRPVSDVGRELNRMGFDERPDLRSKDFRDQSEGKELLVRNDNLVHFVRQESKNLGFGREFWEVALALDGEGRVTNRYCQFVQIPFRAP